MRVSNIYFLVTTILVCIPAFSPLPPYSSIGPLTFVLGMSMLREAYEDFVSKPLANESLNYRKDIEMIMSQITKSA